MQLLRIVGNSLENDHGFTSKEYISINMRPFGEAQVTRAYTQSEQYHTIVKSRDS